MKVPIICKLDTSLTSLIKDKHILEDLLLLGLCDFKEEYYFFEETQNVRLEIEFGVLKELQYLSRIKESYPGIVAGEIILSFILKREKIHFFS